MKRFLVLAAIISAPAAAEDVAYETLVPGEHGSVLLAYDVAPAGHVENCTVERSSGFPRLDEASCRMMVLKARFAPIASRTRATKAIRWIDASTAPRRRPGLAPHPFGDGEGTPDDWAALNPEWGGGVQR